MRLSIITVTFNNSQNIDKTLASLIKYRPQSSEIIVVDNDSADGTAQIVEKFKDVKLIRAGSNLGFSNGCNRGAEVAKGEYLFFLNPDTKLLDKSLDRMLDEINDDQNIGILAPKLILPEGITQASVTKLPTFWGAIKEFWFGQKNEYSQYVPKVNVPLVVEGVYGAAMMIARKNFELAGRFDERYFLYREDLALCRQINHLGLKVVYDPTVKLEHGLGMSTGKINSVNLPGAKKFLANFWPVRNSGANYYQLISGNIYHGILIATLIRLVIYTGLKLRKR